MKKQLPFNFTIPVNDVLCPSVMIGELDVHGVSYSETDFDLNKILWFGIDILPLLEKISPDAVEEIKCTATAHIKYLFTNKNAA